MVTDADIDELVLIGQWLAVRYPATQDSDGGRVLAAVDSLRELKGRLERVEVLLRSMYGVQARTDEDGGREVAAWYYLTDLEHALGVKLYEEES
jgi:hypothetical protein